MPCTSNNTVSRYVISLCVLVLCVTLGTLRHNLSECTLNLDSIRASAAASNYKGLRKETVALSEDITDTKVLFSKFLRKELVDPTACSKSQRFGNAADGGWDVCLDDLKKNNNCIVYSAGTRDDVSFDLAVIQQLDCTVHAFDPSLYQQQGSKQTAKFVKKITEKGVIFHEYGLGGRTLLYPPRTVPWSWPGMSYGAGTNEQPWMLKTLPDIYQELDHSFVDVVKIDIEGAEWDVLQNLLSDSHVRQELRKGSFFRQIMFEVHFLPTTNGSPAKGEQHPTDTTVVDNFNLHAMNMLQQLLQMGFVIWKHDVNSGSPKINDPSTKESFKSCHEIYLVWNGDAS